MTHQQQQSMSHQLPTSVQPITSNSMMGGAGGGGVPMGSNQQQMLNALQNKERLRMVFENANPEQKQVRFFIFNNVHINYT